MSTATRRARGIKLPRKVGPVELSTAIAAVAIVVAILLPLFYDSGSAFIGDSTAALAYVVMALGLNIVVGFAGLLDLGYVAFFAIGAYTMGWFGSSFFTSADVHVGVSGVPERAARDPPELAADPPDRGAVHRASRARCSGSRRCACAGTTSRS